MESLRKRWFVQASLATVCDQKNNKQSFYFVHCKKLNKYIVPKLLAD